jgi:outer membrane protein TolC
MMRARLACLALLPALFAPAAQAQELALYSVVDAALTRGSQVAHADIRVQLAEAQARIAAGVFDWNATARAGWSRLYYPRVQSVGGVQVLTDSLQSSWNPQVTAGASKLFRNGVQIQPGVTFYPGSSASEAQTFGLTRPQPNLNLQVPLLNAFSGNNEAAANERASLGEVDGARLERSAARQQAAMEMAQTYWRCLTAAAEKLVLEANQGRAHAFADRLRGLKGAGQTSSLALEQALIRQANRDKQLEVVRIAELGCRSSLATLLQTEQALLLPRMERAFPEMEGLAAAARTLNEKTLAELAWRNRPDLKALERYAAAAGDRVLGARTGLDPKVNLTIDPNGIFVTLSQNLGANTENGVVARSEAQLREANLKITELKAQIRRDIAQGLASLKRSFGALAERRRSRETLAQAAGEGRQAYFQGSMDAANLRAIEEEQTEAEIQFAEAQMDCALDLAALRLVTGTLLVEGEGAAARNAGLLRSVQF